MITWLRWLLKRPGAVCPTCHGKGTLPMLDVDAHTPAVMVCWNCYGKGTR